MRPTPVRPEDNQEFVSFTPERPENNQGFVSFTPERPEDNQEFVSFTPEIPEDNQEFVSFTPERPEDIQEFVSFTPEENEEITRFSPITIQEDDQTPKLAPLTVEDSKVSMAGPSYSTPEQTVTSIPSVSDVEMVPFVNLGEPSSVTEAPEELLQSDEKSEKIIKPVKVLQDLPVEPEKPAPAPTPMSKHELIQMAVDRLKEMEDKKGNIHNASCYHVQLQVQGHNVNVHDKPLLTPSNKSDIITEMMEELTQLEEDSLYVLEPVVEGDVIKITDGPTMDGLRIIEFVQEEN